MGSIAQNLAFSLNATVPVFLMMVAGMLFRKIGLLDDHTVKKINQFAFRILLPALLFKDLSAADFRKVWDGRFVAFCCIITLLCIGIAFLFSLVRKNPSERGEIIQASYRSSAAILGIAFVNNIYGEATMAALMIVGTVPIYNIIAVSVLSVTSPDNRSEKNVKDLLLRTMKDVVTNPIIIGIAAGFIWSFIGIPQPVILSKSVAYLANMATPLSLIALGASFRLQDVRGNAGLSFGIAGIKLLLFCLLFLPLAVHMGFRGEKLIAILVMLGSATTGSCFVMARNFGHKGTITACSVMLTTLLSAFTLTMWLFVLKCMGHI